MQRTIRIKKYFPYSTEHIWFALTDAVTLGKWFMKNDLEPKVNHEFTFKMAPQKGWNGITHCKIIELDPFKHIAYTYQGEASGEKALACAGVHSDTADKAAKGIFAQLDTIVSFTLEQTGNGTILTMNQSGYKGLKLIIVSLIMEMGWKKQLGKKLPLVLEKLQK